MNCPWPLLNSSCGQRGARPVLAFASSAALRARRPHLPGSRTCPAAPRPAQPAPWALTFRRSSLSLSRNSASCLQLKDARARNACRGPAGKSGSRVLLLLSEGSAIVTSTCSTCTARVKVRRFAIRNTHEKRSKRDVFNEGRASWGSERIAAQGAHVLSREEGR